MASNPAQMSGGERERVKSALAKVLQSPNFAAASRLQELLRYLVNETLEGRGERINQSSIAIDVLGRDASFDPAVDSVVRVEAGRLRTKLRDYYDGSGLQDTVRIELPKGLYVPRISFVDSLAAAEPDKSVATPASQPPLLSMRHHLLLGASLGLILLGAAILYISEDTEQGSEAAAAALDPVPAAYAGGKSLAVLPFANSSATEENAGFFADGLHDDLLTQLTKIADLKVISRTSVMGYRGAAKPIPQIAQELGVNAVLEGAVQRLGDRVRVNVQLIDGATDKHIWAESFDQELNATNIFEIQRRIALEIATTLQAQLSPQEKQRLAVLPTQNFEAYEAYLRARQQLAKRTVADMREASELFRRALGLDPQFALAYAGLAESAYLLHVYSGLTRSAMLEQAEPALDRAFALNDQIGEAWTVRGAILSLKGETDAAEQAYRRAIDLNPNYAQAWHWYGSLLERIGERDEESLRLAQRARELDPLSPLLRTNLGLSYQRTGRFEEARAEIGKALELVTDFTPALIAMGYIDLVAGGSPVDAMIWFARAVRVDGGPEALGGVSDVYHTLGEFEASADWMDRLGKEAEDGDLQIFRRVLIDYARGNDETAAERARRALSTTGKFGDGARPLMHKVLRDLDVRARRYAEARDRYVTSYPQFMEPAPAVQRINLRAAIDLALVLQALGQDSQANALLEAASVEVGKIPRLGIDGHGLADVEIAALRGDREAALSALRAAVDAGWTLYWWDLPQRNPNLALLHGDPQFEALMSQVLSNLSHQAEEVRELERSGQVPPL